MDAPTKQGHPPSPARSDESNESEGRPVREKLKETRIDAQGTSDKAPASDQAMNDAPTNGTRADPSTSGSDSERGRLRRKRSRENFEEDEEIKHPDKKPERHVRKKSREVAGPKETGVESAALVKPAIAPISEKDGVGSMQAQELATAQHQGTAEGGLADKHVSGVASPKNKRTRDQAEAGAETTVAPIVESAKESTPAPKTEDERTTKRARDAVDSVPVTENTENKVKIPAGSGFANTSSASPFATMSPKPQTSRPAEASAKGLPQTSDSAFKNSAFGGFASKQSPFSVTPGASPFGPGGGNKLGTFASNSATSTAKPSGITGIENKTPSIFGTSTAPKPTTFGNTTFSGTTFGSAGGFGSAGSLSKKGFGSGSEITGLKKTVERPFGSKEVTGTGPKADNENGEDGSDKEDGDDTEEQDSSERRTSQPLLQSQGPPETGEENEDNIYTGRARFYTLVGEAGKKSWQERGVGALKLNITREEPRKARFVLRADGTHRLLLNAAVTASMRFGDAEGKAPGDGRLLFNAPTASGEVESHLLRLRSERATELWAIVEGVKQDL